MPGFTEPAMVMSGEITVTVEAKDANELEDKLTALARELNDRPDVVVAFYERWVE